MEAGSCEQPAASSSSGGYRPLAQTRVQSIIFCNTSIMTPCRRSDMKGQQTHAGADSKTNSSRGRIETTGRKIFNTPGVGTTCPLLEGIEVRTLRPTPVLLMPQREFSNAERHHNELGYTSAALEAR